MRQTLNAMKPKLITTQPFESSWSLRTRFQIGIALCLLVVCFTSAFFIYRHEKRQLEEIAHANTELVMAAVEASRAYIREELRPRMFDAFGPDFFMMEAMSTSYVGRAIMDRFGHELADFRYRRVSINARNPAAEADALERRMIDYFKQNPGQRNWQGMAGTQNEAHFVRYQPVFFENSCMHCHGDPADAPTELVRSYGADNGFGHYPGELAGIITVGVPVHKALADIKGRATSVFLTVFLFVSMFYLFLTFFFNRIVVNDLRGVLTVFREAVDEDLCPEPSDELPVNDELHALTLAATNMAGQLRRSRQALELHNLELERKVAKRTRALQESRRLLQEKVTARNQELKTLNRISELTSQARGMEEIWPSVLGESLAMIPIQGVGLYLLQEEQQVLQLHFQQGADGLPRQIHPSPGAKDPAAPKPAAAAYIGQAFAGQVTRFLSRQGANCLNVPIACRGKSLGVISFLERPGEAITPDQQALLLSIGRQIGIALESFSDRQRLVQSKELLQSAFDGITDMVVLLDSDFRIKMVNQAYLRRYEVTLADVYDAPCYEAHSGNLAPCADCGLKSVVNTRKAVTQEVRYPGGALFMVQFYPVLDDAGRLVRIIRYSREITDQKKMEQKIQQAEKLVAMGQLAAGVAHEINNPLGVILCYVDLLKRALADFPQGLKDLATIEKQALNSKRIVSDLLQFARSHESAKQAAAFNRIVFEVVQLLSHQFKKQKVRVDLQLDEAVPHIVMDVNKIKQVLINLLINACQAMEGPGAITITTVWQADEKWVEVHIRDNGKGIAPAMKSKIFDPFFTTKATGQSTGLGLSVSYGIVQDHGGEITVESEPGQWTCFTIRLPLEA